MYDPGVIECVEVDPFSVRRLEDSLSFCPFTQQPHSKRCLPAKPPSQNNGELFGPRASLWRAAKPMFCRSVRLCLILSCLLKVDKNTAAHVGLIVGG